MNNEYEKRKNYNEDGLRLLNKKQYLLLQLKLLEKAKEQQEELEEYELNKKKK